MYIIDCGINKSTIYNSDTNSITRILHDEILKLPNELPPNSFVVAEYAHLGCPRKKLSRSQPFTEQQLLNLYDNFKKNNITLKLFPHQSTPRACNYSSFEKSDETDPIAIYLLLKDFPNISLMNPPQSFDISNVKIEGYEFKQETNNILNFARRYEYLDETDQNTLFIKKNIGKIASKLSDNAKSVFNLTDKSQYKKGDKKGEFNINSINIPQIYSILSILQSPEGKLRLRQNGQLPGWRFASRNILCMSPFHFRGGVARSNLYYHGIRHWVAKRAANELNMAQKEFLKKRRGGYRDEHGIFVNRFNKVEDDIYLKYRRIYCKAVKEMFIICKQILIEEEKNMAKFSNLLY